MAHFLEDGKTRMHFKRFDFQDVHSLITDIYIVISDLMDYQMQEKDVDI